MKLIALRGGAHSFFVFLSQLAQGRGGTLVMQLIRQQAALLRHFAQVGFLRPFLHRQMPYRRSSALQRLRLKAGTIGLEAMAAS